MSTCTSHVLDAALGTPAVAMEVSITASDGSSVQRRTTDADGRVRFEGEFVEGEYVLEFATGEWFDGQGRDTFYPRVQIVVAVVATQEHYHVALLLSPYAYTTYRGS